MTQDHKTKAFQMNDERSRMTAIPDSDSASLGSNPSSPASVSNDLRAGNLGNPGTFADSVPRKSRHTVGRVLVCGGRDFNDHARLYHALDDIQDERGEFACVITGDAKGADHWAESWAWMEKVSHLKFAADWTGYGRAAGPIRNQIMIEEGKPDLVVAFPGGRGTQDLVRRVRKAGIETLTIGWNHHEDTLDL